MATKKELPPGGYRQDESSIPDPFHGTLLRCEADGCDRWYWTVQTQYDKIVKVFEGIGWDPRGVFCESHTRKDRTAPKSWKPGPVLGKAEQSEEPFYFRDKYSR